MTPTNQWLEEKLTEFEKKFVCRGETKICRIPHEPMLDDKANYESLRAFICSALQCCERQSLEWVIRSVLVDESINPFDSEKGHLRNNLRSSQRAIIQQKINSLKEE